MAQSRFSARDQRYLNATRFEVYMIVGLVFTFGFTASFILSVVYHAEPWLWPGALLSIIVSYLVLRVLKRREYAEKLRELEADYGPAEPTVD